MEWSHSRDRFSPSGTGRSKNALVSTTSTPPPIHITPSPSHQRTKVTLYYRSRGVSVKRFLTTQHTYERDPGKTLLIFRTALQSHHSCPFPHNPFNAQDKKDEALQALQKSLKIGESFKERDQAELLYRKLAGSKFNQ